MKAIWLDKGTEECDNCLNFTKRIGNDLSNKGSGSLARTQRVVQMRNFLRVLLPLSAVVLALILPVSGQAQEKKYRFELFGGISLPMDKDFRIGYPQADFPIEGNHEFSAGGQGGVRMGIDGARYWGQDYAYSYGANASRLVTPYGRFAFTNRFHQASSNILFYPWSLDRRSCFPYVTAGVGATFAVLAQETITEALDPLEAGIGPMKSEKIFAFNAGTGVRFRLNERFGLRLDVRDYMSRPVRYGLPKSSNNPDESVLPVSGVFHQFAGSIAVVVHF